LHFRGIKRAPSGILIKGEHRVPLWETASCVKRAIAAKRHGHVANLANWAKQSHSFRPLTFIPAGWRLFARRVDDPLTMIKISRDADRISSPRECPIARGIA